MKGQRLGWAPYALLLPSLVFLAVFFAVPMVRAFGLAFRDDGVWTLEAWRTMFDDGDFREALTTTLLLIVVIIPVQFTLAMAMALVVNARLKASGLWLYVYAIPLGISDLAAGIVWLAIFDRQGWLNSILHDNLGFLDRQFIFLNYQERGWLIFAIVLAEAWRATSIIMIILVAGLQGIPRDFFEAADVFGATTWQKVRRVILPMLRPSVQVALILRTILAFQAFAVVIALAGSGTTVLASEAYRWYYNLRDSHVAAAYAALILVLSVLSTVLFLVLLPTREEQMG
jgi:multiple sugar transport system permease protein